MARIQDGWRKISKQTIEKFIKIILIRIKCVKKQITVDKILKINIHFKISNTYKSGLIELYKFLANT